MLLSELTVIPELKNREMRLVIPCKEEEVENISSALRNLSIAFYLEKRAESDFSIVITDNSLRSLLGK